MHFGADMMRNEAYDAFGLRRGQHLIGGRTPAIEAIDP